MEVRRDGTLAYHLNGQSIGNAYKNSRLTEENVYPWVFICDEGDCVEVLHGN
jgi:hypothetical protein